MGWGGEVDGVNECDVKVRGSGEEAPGGFCKVNTRMGFYCTVVAKCGIF